MRALVIAAVMLMAACGGAVDPAPTSGEPGASGVPIGASAEAPAPPAPSIAPGAASLPSSGSACAVAAAPSACGTGELPAGQFCLQSPDGQAAWGQALPPECDCDDTCACVAQHADLGATCSIGWQCWPTARGFYVNCAR